MLLHHIRCHLPNGPAERHYFRHIVYTRPASAPITYMAMDKYIIWSPFGNHSRHLFRFPTTSMVVVHKIYLARIATKLAEPTVRCGCTSDKHKSWPTPCDRRLEITDQKRPPFRSAILCRCRWWRPCCAYVIHYNCIYFERWEHHSVPAVLDMQLAGKIKTSPISIYECTALTARWMLATPLDTDELI